MTFTPAELKRRALDFSREHANDNDEKSQAQTFWRDFFAIFGLSPQRIGTFEARAKTLRGTVGFIDFFWPGTLLVEHKSLGKDLDEALKQALDYCSTGGLKDTELPRFIVVCDFQRFLLVELATGERQEFVLADLHEKLHFFDFVLGRERRAYRDEDPVNIKAAELMGVLHDDLRRVGYIGHDLELFLVRLMFCFFADDTGIFQKDQFADYLEARSRDDGSDTGRIIEEMFRILDMAPDKRSKNLPEDLAALPYVNGQLFAERVDPPYFDAGLRATLLHCARFNWGAVSPAIFGSLFQSVMDPGERRSLGAHYTSEKNILKTIHGLFLDELQEEFERIQGRKTGAGDKEKLYRALLDRIAAIRLLDPACGCGNFLILSYRELRRMEISIHREIRTLTKDSSLSLDVGWEARGITVDHIYGIEIEEFPAQIARVALWIMDHLMNVELAATLGGYRPSIPLVASPKIVHGNALRIDWADVVKPEELTYILGNPPFVGKQYRTTDQFADMTQVLEGKVDRFGDLDLVSTWYVKTIDFIQNTPIKCALVSTNSICQGEQVGILWGYLYTRGAKIHFAHRTFKWTNEAKANAAVHVVIVGFGLFKAVQPILFTYEKLDSEPKEYLVKNINSYLVDGPDTIVSNRADPICKVPKMAFGSMPRDGGNLVLSTDEKNVLVQREPGTIEFIRPYVGSDEFINGKERFCLWLVGANPAVLKKFSGISDRVQKTKLFRESSKAGSTRNFAKTPGVFCQIAQPNTNYILVPGVSSERRYFVPIGFMDSNVIASNLVFTIPNATLFHLGVLTSTMHMAWMRVVCGRLKSDYRYSKDIVYNNFPWPKDMTGCVQGSGAGGPGEGIWHEDVARQRGPGVSPGEGVAEDANASEARGRPSPTEIDKLKTRVEACAQGVLDTRGRYPEASLADLYDPLTMPPDLVKAHRDLDGAVDKCYRKEPFKSELERVEFLFGLYEEYTAGLLAVEKPKKGKRG